MSVGEGQRQGAAARVPALVTVLAVVLTALALTGVERMLAASLATAERGAVIDKASSLRAALETSVNRNVLLLRGMAAYIASHPDLEREEFATLARDLVTQGRNIRNMAFARGTVLTYIYPHDGNEAAIGVDLAARPDQREAALRAISARDVVVAGPVELVEGGEAFIGRMPIHLSPPGGPPRSGAFIGLVTLPLNAAGIYRDAGLDAPDHGLRIALRGRDATGRAGDIFHGEPALFDTEPVLLDVSLAGGGQWQLAAVPAKGWGAGGRGVLWLVRALAAGLVLAAGALAWSSSARAAERRAVEEELRRTATIDLDTGGANRRHFLAAGAAELARSRRFGHPFSVLAVRLEQAAAMDASFGRGAMAAVLRAVVAYGRRDLRAIDLLARVDDDTFAVLLPETPPNAATAVARRLCRHFSLVGVPWRDRAITPRFLTAVSSVRQEDGGIEDILARALARLDRPGTGTGTEETSETDHAAAWSGRAAS